MKIIKATSQAKMDAALVLLSDIATLNVNKATHTTQPFSESSAHTTDPNIFWVRLDRVYPHLGQVGKAVFDGMGGSCSGAAEFCVEDIPDLVESGYLPVEIEED